MSAPLPPGIIVLHGNRLEMLRDAVFDWIGRHPLDPLEEEIFLVQSNGAAEWLKMELARHAGVCAATRVELPGRFLWRTYRQVIGRTRVPAQSPLEREALAWRLMRLLPTRLGQPEFAPVAAFLADGDPERRLELARRLADLYDQYQVYRADWLDDWARGVDRLRGSNADATPPDQAWQPLLWRDILASLTREEREVTRPRIHRRFIDAIEAGTPPADPLPRRVVFFGAAHASFQMLEALGRLGTVSQVVFAIPNPCRFYWADIIEGRDALRTGRQRHPLAHGRPLADLPLEHMHLHAHPLLAAWGRQGRDFMRLLDRYDDLEAARARFDLPRFDLFDDGPGTSLLADVQAKIRDLVPLAEHERRAVPASDRSIVFHVAHTAQREVEILHDRLLDLFAGDLGPRDVVVMVPDIESFAPAIRAVFGQHRSGDPRNIPFDIADLRSRGSNPLMIAIEWLLRLPEHRATLSEVRALFDVPAIAARFGIDAEAVPKLFTWLSGAGVRWGLHEGQRAALGLGSCGAQNTWSFGLRRMLLGYATGGDAAFAGVEPYDEIGGLEAADIGAAAALVERLDAWWLDAGRDATPAEWATRGRILLDTFVAATDERERLTVAALQSALAAWLESCDRAGFDERVPLAVLREAWLTGVDGLDAGRRFLTGGVTFCTLMPLRTVPFEVVCLLGMNEGAFPRRGRHDDFDLMGLPGVYRAGDRSRRDDDRYLMLEAVLSARRMLLVSWVGRNVRDNTEEPPSVLVAQLRDYLAAGWRGDDAGDLLDVRTEAHPLQPFGRRYFEAGGLVTWAREWRAVHAAVPPKPAIRPLPIEAGTLSVTARDLGRFLKNPVKAFFRVRLGVVATDDEESDDHESFRLDGLARYGATMTLVAELDQVTGKDVDAVIADRRRRLVGSGRLPLFEAGRRLGDDLGGAAAPMLARWNEFQRRWAEPVPKLHLHASEDDVIVDDWLPGVRSDGRTHASIQLTASRLFDGNGIRAAKLVDAWVRALLAGAAGSSIESIVVGCDATLRIAPLDADAANTHLAVVLRHWRDGMARPAAFNAETALAHVSGGSPRSTYNGPYNRHGERDDFALGRIYPDFDALVEAGFEAQATALFEPMLDWVSTSVTVVGPGEPLA